MFYLYFILNTISGSGYFGVTSNSVSRRFYEHRNNAVNTDKKTKLYDAMRSYGIESFDCYIVAEVDSSKGVFDLEKQAIRLARDRGLHLYNMTNGGEGGFVVPAEKINSWKEKLSKARKGRQPALGMKHTEENKKLFSEVSKKYWDENRIYSPEEISKFSSFKEANKATGISKTHYYRIKRALNND